MVYFSFLFEMVTADICSNKLAFPSPLTHLKKPFQITLKNGNGEGKEKRFMIYFILLYQIASWN